MDVRLPDGTIIKNVPDGTTKADLVSKLQRNGMAVPSEWLSASAPAAPEPKEQPRTLADQLGLTLRAGVKGLAALPALGADAIGGAMNAAQDVAIGKGRGYRFQPTATALDSLMSSAGLPEPRTPMERIASTGAELMAGGAGGARMAQAGADLLARQAVGKLPGVESVAQQTLGRLGSDPLQQTVASGAAGVSGQQAKEAGAGGAGQFVSSLGGGLMGAAALGGARAAAGGVASMLPKTQRANTERMETIIQMSLARGGIDPESITPAMRSMLRENVAKAMEQGPLDEGAVARLADYARLGMTPTRGRLSLDPYDITQEMNASKMAAAMGARDARLPAIAQENNNRLLATVDGMNPIADRFSTGARAMAPIQAEDRAMEAAKKAAYGRANEMAGGDIPLNRAPFMDAIYSRLNKGNLIRHVPPSVQSMLDDISQGVIKRGDQTFDVPFNVDAIDSLKSLIATEQRSTTGSAKMALGEIRKALDSVPLDPVKKQFGGNQVVTEQGAQFLRTQDAQAGNVKAALDEARGLNFNWMRWRESAPGIEAAVNDTNPETFVRNFIRNTGSDARDVQRAAEVINRSPDARNAVRSEIVQHLKDAAIGKGNESATGNFSGRGWSAALDGIADQKLAQFFDRGEIEQLRALGRVGTVETFQPRGSAVNNSNTAAGVAGMLQGLSKYLKPVANKIPLGQEVINGPLDNITLSLIQRGATSLPGGLLARTNVPKRSLLDPLLLPAATGAGLLSTQ